MNVGISLLNVCNYEMTNTSCRKLTPMYVQDMNSSLPDFVEQLVHILSAERKTAPLYDVREKELNN